MADLIQYDSAPAPSKTEFEALSEQVTSLNSNIPKYYYGDINTASIAPATSGNVSIPAPSGATAVKAIIPYGISPSNHWNSWLFFVLANNTAIHYRCEGSGESQVFKIRYVVIYV